MNNALSKGSAKVKNVSKKESAFKSHVLSRLVSVVPIMSSGIYSKTTTPLYYKKTLL
jgi:hypothetical protein